MKKAVSLVLILLMFCSFAISVNAEEFNGADLFTVNLPEGFEQSGTSVSDFTFTNESGDTFTVSYIDNTEKNNIFSPEDMSEKEIEKYTKALSEEAKTVMKDYADDFELKFLSGEKIKHQNGKTALACQAKTTIKTVDETKVYYQTMYEFGGVDYKYTFTYTTADKDKKDSFNEVFETINVFETETQSNIDKLIGFIPLAVIVLLLIIGIIKFIRTPEKRAQGKLK